MTKKIINDYTIIFLSLIPFFSLYLQKAFPKIINSNQVIYASINLICVALLFAYSCYILLKDKTFTVSKKIIIVISLVYLMILVLISIALIVAALQ